MRRLIMCIPDRQRGAPASTRGRLRRHLAVPVALLAALTVRQAAAVADTLPAAPASAASVPAVPARYTVRIEAPDALRELLQDNLDLVRWRTFPDLQDLQIERLVARAPAQAERLLETEGYFSSKVTARLEHTTALPEVVVEVDPGMASRVHGVDLQVLGPDGSPDPKLEERLIRRWALPVGSVFRDAGWEAAKAGALSRLLTGNWPAARIADSRATVDPATQQVELKLVLDTGPAYTFGPLQISGLERYPPSVVRNLSPPAPGSVYDQSKLLDYQAALQNSPYFRNAIVSADVQQAKDGQLPVDVHVSENRARKLGFGVGVSSDTGRRVQMNYRDLNLFGRAWRLSGDVQIESVQQTEALQVAFPRTAVGYEDSVGVSHTRSDIQGLVTRNTTATAQRSRTRGNIDTGVVLQYQVESTQPAGAQSSVIHALSLNGSWTRRDVNSVLYPSRGTIINLQLGGASKALLSSANFVRLYARGVGYLPIDRSNVFVFRGEVGAVIANGAAGIPQSFLFRAGGAQSVRGYAYQSLGLHDGSAIVGGRYLLTSSAEFDHWFTREWGGAVFYDSGNAADTWSALKPVHGYGAGVRWRSPIGLIAVDLAYGQADHKYRMNFSAGLSF